MNQVRLLAKAALQQAAATFGPHRRRAGAPRLWILMYHRVLPKHDSRTQLEEPGMWVSPETFERHIGWAREFLEPVALGAWVRAIVNGQEVPRRAFAVTFDDGWRDNHEYALPILRATGTPATLFAVAGLTGTARSFWPNRLAQLLARAEEQGGAARSRIHSVLVPDARAPSADSGPEALSRLVAACKRLEDDEVSRRIDRLEGELGTVGAGERDLMNWEELDEMVASGLVEVGSHSFEHRRLRSTTPSPVLDTEIVESRRVLEDRLGRPVELFCYPNGDAPDAACERVAETYRAAVTTRRGINDPHTPLTRLRRIGVHEDVSATRRGFLARLAGWP